MAAAPELIPEAVSLAEALPTLGLLAALLFVLGCIYVIDAFVRALFGTVSGAVSWVPWLGHVVTTPVHAVERKITGALGTAESYFDSRIGMSFHKLARIGDQIGRELYGLALVSLTIAKVLTGSLTRADLGTIWHRLSTTWSGLVGQVEKVGSAVYGPLTGELHRLEHWLNARVHALEGAIAGGIPRDIAGLRWRTRTLERGYERLWKEVKRHEKLLGIGALTGVVAVVLGRLGLGWTRCSNVNKLGRNVCGMNAQLLESLLADTLLIAGTLSLVEFAKEMQSVEAGAVRVVQEFWRVG